VNAHVETEAAREALGSLEQQVAALADGAAEVVGQATIREGDVARAFENDDLGALIATAKSSRRRHTGGHATDGDYTAGGICRHGLTIPLGVSVGKPR